MTYSQCPQVGEKKNTPCTTGPSLPGIGVGSGGSDAPAEPSGSTSTTGVALSPGSAVAPSCAVTGIANMTKRADRMKSRVARRVIVARGYLRHRIAAEIAL